MRALSTLAEGSQGRLEFSCADEPYLLDGRRVVGRSTEFYFRLSKRIPKMELYYLFLEEIFPAAKPLVTAEAFKHAISIIRRAGARELEKSGRALVGRSEIDDWAAHVVRYLILRIRRGSLSYRHLARWID